jgi:cysteine synthase
MDITYTEKLGRLSKLVGNTPTLSIECIVEGKRRHIFVKYESVNYSGSIKDRIVLEILKFAHLTGEINDKTTLVEATSGNTGISLAAMGAYLGIPVQIYMPNWLSEERKRILQLYGAELVEIGVEEGGFQRCIELAEEKSQKKGFFCTKQFDNQINVQAHLKSTAPELDMALRASGNGNLDIFVAGAGTGGTVMGFHHYFSQKNDDFVAHALFPDKNEDGAHRIEGIGDSFVPKILDLAQLGETIRVSDADAINVSRQLNRLGLSVGISSGANLFAAAFKAAEFRHSTKVATVFADNNSKYLTTDLCSNTPEPLSSPIKVVNYELIA